jgi:hypothetical protein
MVLASLSFFLAFGISRLAVYGARAQGVQFEVWIGGIHLHHYVWGIVLLLLVGYLWLLQVGAGPTASSRRLGRLTAVIYGVGAALTLDEFALWLHLEDVYWQRASFDAIAVIAALLGIVAAGPSLRRLRPRHWKAAVGLGLAVALFLALVLIPLWSAGRDFGSHLR